MATVSRAHRRARRRDDELLDEPQPRKRRWLFTMIVLVGLPAVLWFAPAIVAHSPLCDRVVAMIFSDLRGTVSVSSASLGWLSPVAARNVEVRDLAGKPLAVVPAVTSSKTLLAILLNMRDLGTFQLDRPQFDVVLRERGSNVEDAIAGWLESKDKPNSPLGISVAINGGVARIDDVAASRQWQVEELDCDVAVPRATDQPIELAASGRVTPGKPAGHFSVRMKLQPGPEGAAAKAAGADSKKDGAAATNLLAGSGDVSVTSEVLPLDLFEPLLRRVAERCELAGLLDANLTARWGPDAAQAPAAELNGQATVTRLVLAGAGLAEDRLRLLRIHVPCSVVRKGDRLEVQRFDIESDVAQLTCSGTIEDISRLGPSWFRSLWDVLPHSAGEIKGNVDLAKLAGVLPSTLHVRDGMQIQEGAVNLDVKAGPENGAWGCTGKVETTRLVATEEGRQVTWDHPLSITVAGHDSPQGPIVERLEGESDFLKFEGLGTPDSFSLSANFELGRLGNELGKFLDLGELALSGDGWGRLNWQRHADDAFEADAEIQATNFALARPGKPQWHDQRLTVMAAAKGQLDGQKIRRVETATVDVESASDQFTLALVTPVEQPTSKTRWPLDASLRGELSRWLARVEPWVGLPADWEVAGVANVISTVNYSAEYIDVVKCQADVEQLHAVGPSLVIDEPRLRVAGTGSLAVAHGKLDLKEATLTAPDVTARMQDATIVFGDDRSPQRVALATLQGNAATLYRWTQDPRQPANWQVEGMVACTLRADMSHNAPSLDLDATIDDLAATPKSGQTWRERQVRLIAKGAYDEKADAVQLARLELASDAVQLNATGRIDRWSKDRTLSIAGKTDYDLEKVTLILQPYFGEGIRLAGRESRSFTLSGPIASATGAPTAQGGAPPAEVNDRLRKLAGRADVGWQSAALYGFDVGPGSLQASLAGGVLSVAPTKLNLSGGTLALAPQLRLSPTPTELMMPAGPLVEQVSITPEMCRNWLMYVAPVVAGVTEAQGKFSVQLAGCRLPLAEMAKGDIAGQMTVHTVEIGPGPLIKELALLLGNASGVKLKRESNVDFRMVEGRVYHRGLELEFPEVTIRTYGSVGLDQTLAIMAEMPVPQKWLKENLVGAALKDQVIRLPIAGTLEKPEVDRRVLADLQRQFIREAGGNLLRNELGRQLDRLLEPLAPKQ
ncbi:MAG: hypothetical protein HYX69_08140 [Planctomycetia bacterium]|nr:hypothetical protein [Planctomycetia bacterium]